MKIRYGLTCLVLITTIVITSANAGLQRYSDSDLDASQCEWGEWSREECSVSCGGGMRKKTQMLQPKEGNVGECLDDVNSEYEVCNTNVCPVCNTNPCPVNCVWGEWKNGACSKSCGLGFRTDERTVEVPEAHGGTCIGEPSRERRCFLQQCPKSGLQCCREKGVHSSCLGNCDRAASAAQRDLFDCNTCKCKQYEKIINECNNGSLKGRKYGARGNACNVSEESVTQVVESCNCSDLENSDCQLQFIRGKFSCKNNVSEACLLAVKDEAYAYSTASNANDPECKYGDPNYERAQETWASCALGA